jgi:hypothetical protein
MLGTRLGGRLIAGSVMLLAACSGGGGDTAQSAANPCNPCTAMNACNPCAAKNPCSAANPCNPCAAAASLMGKISQGDRELYTGGRSSADLAAMGEKLFSDKALSSSGTTSCSTCHTNGYGMMNATFAEPYPHHVEMAKERAGLEKVTAAEMVQLCMVIPMQNDPLDWNSVELTALSEYVTQLQAGFDASMATGMNPCNPCAAKNPCNPCATKNPCAGKNPCNPCKGGN